MASNGATHVMIAAAIGMTPSGLKRWRDDEPDFATELREAMSRDAMKAMNGVNAAIERGDARAAQWKLRTRLPHKGGFWWKG